MFHIAAWLRRLHDSLGEEDFKRSNTKWIAQKYTKPTQKSKGQRQDNTDATGNGRDGGDGQQNTSEPPEPVDNASLLQSAGFTSVASVQPWYYEKYIDDSGNIMVKTPVIFSLLLVLEHGIDK